MNRSKLFNALVILIVIAAAGGYILLSARARLNETDGKSWVKLGMDLQGGVMLVLEVQDTEQGEIDAQVVEDTRAAMEKRIDSLGVIEPVIEKMSGENWRRITVSLPGVTSLDQALDVVGRQGLLEFQLNGQSIMSGPTILAKATPGYSSNNNKPAVHLELSSEYSAKFATITRNNIGQNISIMLDGQEVVSGIINSEIPNGKAEISGGDITIESATSIAAILRGGVLPAPVEHKETRFVDPTLGADMANSSLIAGAVGMVLIFLYMIVIYRLPGLLAGIALCIYAGIVLAVFMAINGTLSLAGIAGFILSTGMAVDANVIIFERIKDELRAGKSMRASVDSGFHKAMTAIIDGNATTIITAIILFYFGSGRVQGFAVTLIIGVLASMFTAVVLTKMLLSLVVTPGMDIKFFGVRR